MNKVEQAIFHFVILLAKKAAAHYFKNSDINVQPEEAEDSWKQKQLSEAQKKSFKKVLSR